MRLGNVNHQESHPFGRVRAKQRAIDEHNIQRIPEETVGTTYFIRSADARNGGQLVEPAKRSDG